MNTSVAVITHCHFFISAECHASREHIEVGKEEFNVHKEKGHAALRQHIEVGKEEIEHTTGTVKIK